jgi:hypothetical protein
MTYRACRVTRILATVLVCALGSVTIASAQSLAAVAKAEESKRKALKKPAKVYTNSTLPTVPAETTTTTPAVPTPAGAEEAEGAAAAPAAPAAPGAPAPETPATDTRRTPDYWKKRMADATAERDTNQLMLDALQSRINGLWADFTARDDPAQRTIIANERQKALDEFDRRKKRQAELVKAITDLEDEARRAGVPAGWLR